MQVRARNAVVDTDMLIERYLEEEIEELNWYLMVDVGAE